ncbi:MAG: outer membrane beta-barrel protein [Treponema sp.]|jgi:hypothetical protein|nr:outer membrane beta-barrel protein [Treponema sp.]
MFTGTVFLSAQQNPQTLDEAIGSAAAYFSESGQLNNGARIAVLNVQSGWKPLSDYAIDELTRHIVNGKTFTVVERLDLSRLQEELNFQLSGMVSDETIQGIGKLWGAQVIISGSFETLGDRYRLNFKALEVETGRIAAQAAFDVYPDSRLNSLLSGTGEKKITRFSAWLNSNDSWKHKWLYPGIRAGVSFCDYTLNASESSIAADTHAAFNVSALLEAQLSQFLALQTEAAFSEDKVAVRGAPIGDISLQSYTLTVPVLLKFTWRPKTFYLAAFAGPGFVLPLGQLNMTANGASESYNFSSTIELTAGANIGVKAGSGILFFDVRYNRDFNFVRFDNSAQYRRNTVSLSLGYQYGIANKGASHE